jgi:hypothetical protein
MNDPDDYYRTLAEDRPIRRPRSTNDPVDRAAAAIGQPLSPPDVDHV